MDLTQRQPTRFYGIMKSFFRVFFSKLKKGGLNCYFFYVVNIIKTAELSFLILRYKRSFMETNLSDKNLKKEKFIINFLNVKLLNIIEYTQIIR